MHPVTDQEIFLRVADRRGFTVAGRELRMSTAVVSSRIAKLEQRLGFKLFIRNTRDVRMTEEGEIYYEFSQRIVSEEAELQKRLQEIKAHPSGALKVSAPITLGRTIVAPYAPKFQMDNPDVQLRVQLTDRLANIIDEDIDVAVRTGELEASTLKTVSLAPDLQIVCGAPSYLARHAPPSAPDDLREHNCLLLRFPGSRRYYWRFVHDDTQIKNTMASGVCDSNSSDVLLDWAMAGQGLAMLSVWDAYEGLQSGALKPVLTPYSVPNQTISAIMPPRSPQPVKTTTFVNALRELFEAHPAHAVATKSGFIERFGTG